ncbi:MAG: hypothetical protein AAFX99_21145 [Myxococcota bacterium]
MEEKRDETLKKIEHLRRPPEEGENEQSVKIRNIQANAYESKTLKIYERHIKKFKARRDKFQAKVDGKVDEAQELAANNTAMIKSDNGMTNGRPKKGEYIILAQVPGGGDYGVSEQTQVALAGGAFKHIAVFMGAEGLPKGVEKWTTIDGGGTKGKETILYVRTADRLVFRTSNIKEAEPGKPWTGTKATSQLAGWIDMDELVAMRDRKAEED